MKNKGVFIILLCIIFIACDRKNTIKGSKVESENSEIIKIKGSYQDGPVDILPFLDSVKYVKLELTDKSIIGYIQKVVVFKNRIYVLDTQTSSLFVFDINGKYIFKIANLGQGPGEYTQLDFFDIDRKKEQIVLTDLMGNWVMRFDLQGTFLQKMKIPLWVEGVVPNNDKGLVAYANFRDNKTTMNNEFNIIYMDSAMKVRKAYFPYNSSRIEELNIKFSTPQSSVFYSFKDNFCFFSPYGNNIYEIDGEKLLRKYTFDFGDKSFDVNTSPSDDLEKVKQYIDDNNFYFIHGVQETNKLLMFSFSAPNSPQLYQGYYSKGSKKLLCSPFYFVGKEGQFDPFPPIATYNSWIISELSVDYLLSLRNDLSKQVFKNKFFQDKKTLVEQLTVDDNSILMFYKFTEF